MEFSEFGQLQYLIKKQTDKSASEEIIDQTQMAGSIDKGMIGSYGFSSENMDNKFGQRGAYGGQSAQLNYTIDNNATYKQAIYNKDAVIDEEDSNVHSSYDDDEYSNDDSYGSGDDGADYRMHKRKNSLDQSNEEKERDDESEDRFANIDSVQDYRKETGSRQIKKRDIIDKDALQRNNSKTSGSSGGAITKQSSSPKKKKRKKSGEDDDLSKTSGKVLTFVDMSQLSYLSQSHVHGNNVTTRRWSQSDRIQESDHEESDENEKDSSADQQETRMPLQEADDLKMPLIEPQNQKIKSGKVNRTSNMTVKEFCQEVLDDLVNLITDSQDDGKQASEQATDLVDNKIIMKSLQTLRKKPFIKEQIIDQDIIQKDSENTNQVDQITNNEKREKRTSFKRLLGRPTMNQVATKSSFKKSSDTMNNLSRPTATNGRQKTSVTTFVRKRRTGPEIQSALTDLVDNMTGNEFVLQPPALGSPDYLKTTIYFFGKPESIQIEISNQCSVKDVLKHIITLYKHNKALTDKFGALKNEDENMYELRLIDDYESPYCPDYEMNALDIEEQVGEFDSLAFVNSKKQQAKIDKQKQEQVEWEKALKEKGQRHIIVKCNTSLLTASVELLLREEDKIMTILEQVPKKFNRQKFDPSKYVLLPIDMQRYGEMQDVVDYFGGYNPLEGSKQLIDPQTTVRNIPVKTIELREKIFVDKPGVRQMDIPLEVRHNNPYTYKDSTKFGENMGFSVIDQFEVNGHNTFANPNRLTQNLANQRKNSTFSNKFGDDRRGDYRKEEDFLFGQISGSQLQQFKVIKFNRKDRPQPRILCIDGYNIYNKKTTENDEAAQTGASMSKKSSLFGSLLSKSIFSAKRKQRPISSIKQFDRITDTMLIISFQDKPNEPLKRLKYQTDNPEVCSEILAKIRFLTTNNREKQTFMQQNQQIIIPNMMMTQTMGSAPMNNMQQAPTTFY